LVEADTIGKDVTEEAKVEVDEEELGATVDDGLVVRTLPTPPLVLGADKAGRTIVGAADELGTAGGVETAESVGGDATMLI